VTDSSLLLPSSAQIVGAFVRDLQNVLHGQTDEPPTRTIVFTFLAAQQQSWTADRDVVIVGVYANGAIIVSLNASYVSYNSVYGVTKVYSDIIFVNPAAATQSGYSKIFFPVTTSTKVYVLSNGVGHAILNMQNA